MTAEAHLGSGVGLINAGVGGGTFVDAIMGSWIGPVPQGLLRIGVVRRVTEYTNAVFMDGANGAGALGG